MCNVYYSVCSLPSGLRSRLDLRSQRGAFKLMLFDLESVAPSCVVIAV